MTEPQPVALRDMLAEIERRYIEEALSQSEGVIADAARLLAGGGCAKPISPKAPSPKGDCGDWSVPRTDQRVAAMAGVRGLGVRDKLQRGSDTV
jgi:hypothetical protein